MDVEGMLQDRLKVLFLDQIIDLKLKEILRDAAVNHAQILRKYLVEEESSESGLHDSGYLLAGFVPLGNADFYPGVKVKSMVLIRKKRLVDITVYGILAKSAGTFLS